MSFKSDWVLLFALEGTLDKYTISKWCQNLQWILRIVLILPGAPSPMAHDVINTALHVKLRFVKEATFLHEDGACLYFMQCRERCTMPQWKCQWKERGPVIIYVLEGQCPYWGKKKKKIEVLQVDMSKNTLRLMAENFVFVALVWSQDLFASKVIWLQVPQS